MLQLSLPFRDMFLGVNVWHERTFHLKCWVSACLHRDITITTTAAPVTMYFLIPLSKKQTSATVILQEQSPWIWHNAYWYRVSDVLELTVSTFTVETPPPTIRQSTKANVKTEAVKFFRMQLYTNLHSVHILKEWDLDQHCYKHLKSLIQQCMYVPSVLCDLTCEKKNPLKQTFYVLSNMTPLFSCRNPSSVNPSAWQKYTLLSRTLKQILVMFNNVPSMWSVSSRKSTHTGNEWWWQSQNFCELWLNI